MTRLVELGAVKVAGDSKSDPVPQLLLVTQTDLRSGKCQIVMTDYSQCSHLAVGIDLGPQAGVLVQSVLAADGKAGGSSDGAVAGDSGLQLGAVLQENASSE